MRCGLRDAARRCERLPCVAASNTKNGGDFSARPAVKPRLRELVLSDSRKHALRAKDRARLSSLVPLGSSFPSCTWERDCLRSWASLRHPPYNFSESAHRGCSVILSAIEEPPWVTCALQSSVILSDDASAVEGPLGGVPTCCSFSHLPAECCLEGAPLGANAPIESELRQRRASGCGRQAPAQGNAGTPPRGPSTALADSLRSG